MMCPENLPPAGPGRAHAECYTSLRPTPGPSPPTGEAPRQSNARSDSGSPSRSDPRSDLEYSVEVAVGKSRSLGVVVYGDGGANGGQVAVAQAGRAQAQNEGLGPAKGSGGTVLRVMVSELNWIVRIGLD